MSTAKVGRRRCVFCRRCYVPDPRVGKRQKSCGLEQCSQKRKKEAQKRWAETNPGYWKPSFTDKDEIQDEKLAKISEESITLIFSKKLFQVDFVQDEIIRTTSAAHTF